MPRDRDHDMRTLRSVQEAAQRGDHAEAARLAEIARDGGLEHPLLLNVLALRLEQQQRVAEATELLLRAVEMAPNDVASRNALGLCLLRLDRPADALVHFDVVLAASPLLPFAHTNRGNAALALGGLASAEASYRRALELDPRQVAAMAGLAHIAARRGSYPEARAWAEKALAAVPDFPDAVFSLAAAELAEGHAQQAAGRLGLLIAKGKLEPLDRAYACGQLGDTIDAVDRPAEAFAAYELCNQTLREHYAPRFGAGPSALAHVRAMSDYFQRQRPEAWRPQPAAATDACPAAAHVFLLGFPRSGTTLLEVALEGHPRVVTLEEHELLIDAVHAYLKGPEDLERLRTASAQELQLLREAYWMRARQAGVTVAGKTFVDKHPFNTLKLPLIARLFPEAKILYARRDPRDVVLSCFRRRFQMSALTYQFLTLDGAARYYDAVMRFVERLDAVLATHTRVVVYERLVADFEAELAAICGFLGLDWNPAMTDIAARARRRSTATPSTAQLTRGLETPAVAPWKRYRAQLEPVLGRLQPWVERFGYDP